MMREMAVLWPLWMRCASLCRGLKDIEWRSDEHETRLLGSWVYTGPTIVPRVHGISPAHAVVLLSQFEQCDCLSPLTRINIRVRRVVGHDCRSAEAWTIFDQDESPGRASRSNRGCAGGKCT